LEVAGYDGGPLTQYCADNFVIDTLTVNDIMSLWDNVDNGNRGGPYQDAKKLAFPPGHSPHSYT
jgi:hypothetical protein